MGFDNECILNIQSLAGEYFCPVCRTLVYPHEALQTQCTHLYCKPCLTYVVSSTQACPYDGYLVTEAGSKPLMESNKALAETIGKTTVHCLYHRSGCMWQGPLSECTTHCTGCSFGNSPVVCNRCGIQIVHRQVQEHAQSCNVNQGTNTQPQQASDTAQGPAVSVDQNKVSANQVAVPPASQPQSQPQPQLQTSHTATGLAAPQNLNQPATANPLPQAMPAAAVSTSDQWYQQQYQQYYQQYPGYDPYQQQAYQQQYYPYQQQPQNPVQTQIQPQSQPQIQQQVQAPMQFQPPVQPQLQVQNQGQPQPSQMHSQAQPQVPSGQPQPMYPQAAVVGLNQSQGQVNQQQQAHPGMQPQVQIQPIARGPPMVPPQSYPQVQSHPVPQPHMQVAQYQQPQAQMHHSQPPQVHPQPPPHSHFQPQPINPQHATYPSQPHQHAPPQQHPMQVQPSTVAVLPAQFPQPPPHIRPTHMMPSQGQTSGIPPTQQHIHPHSQPAHQRPVVPPQVQQPMPPQQYVQQPQAFPGAFPQVRPPQQPPLGYVQPQPSGTTTVLPHGMPPHQSQNYGGRPQQFPQSSGPAGMTPHAIPPQFIPANPSNQPQIYSDQQQPNQYGTPMVDRNPKGEQQEDKSPSVKKPDSVKPETGINDEHRPANGVGDETSTKDNASELHQTQGDSVTAQRFIKEEKKDGVLEHPSGQNKAEDDSVKQPGSSEVDNGTLNGPLNGKDRINEQSSQSALPYPPVSYGQQQRPAAPQPPSHIRPPGHGYPPPGPHQPGPGPFHPEYPMGGPPPSVGSAPLTHGPDGAPRYPGQVETDMYQNHRPPPPPFDSRRPDSYGQPSFGAESNSMRMNGGPPPPPGHHDSTSAYGFRDDKFRNSDGYPMGPSEFKGGLKQFLGNEDSSKFASRPYGMDGPSRFLDKDPHGYGYHSGGGLHPNEPGGRFDNNSQNPDFHAPMHHGFGRHRMGPGSPPSHSFGAHMDMDGREMERHHPFGERFPPMGPPGHMHRGEFDGPGKLRGGEPFGLRNPSGFGSFLDYNRSGESDGPFGESFGPKSIRPHLGEPGFRSSYSRQGFPSDGGFYPGGPDSFEARKRSSLSMGWCRICKVDCESVEGLDIHGQTRDHQRKTMDMVISIKQNNAKKHKTSNDHSTREEANKLRNSESHARVNIA